MLAAHIRNSGAPLIVRTGSLGLSNGVHVDCGSSRDNISGVAMIDGVGAAMRASTSCLS
jgi:hypothetical protein